MCDLQASLTKESQYLPSLCRSNFELTSGWPFFVLRWCWKGTNIIIIIIICNSPGSRKKGVLWNAPCHSSALLLRSTAVEFLTLLLKTAKVSFVLRPLFKILSLHALLPKNARSDRVYYHEKIIESSSSLVGHWPNFFTHFALDQS